ncbi:MAG: 30S ribosomal protein S17 [Candidatus Neomarinimicrobiota bacterium]|uniref:30S ribosomal protein S17 n=1 Tax=marine metagenome TaxID=408172 RepID=A0A382PWI0_9ZZZZ|nr:30S ribosomal protein S17 [Candidatus Neomarinimicrobiota bacterium]MBO62627.1 30S ribosomal protein S17 [Candidatus Neomarinimicrobiota bacterium]MEC7848488.1 30S ribosomal protein S17 [Candidatus Neomarinimicrobiota bacterium]|tara:strand:- start:7269 stop:7535 length:267 start_codon:yes stop_codon:yes gene_type:complete
MNKKRKRQILTGRVISGEMSKTVNVRVTREIPHPVYKKRVKRYKNYLAHVESVAPKEGDIVRIASVRPISKNKRWQVSEIIREAVIIG